MGIALEDLHRIVRVDSSYLLGMNKNTVQRIFQLKGWQVRKRAIGFQTITGNR
jgi:hypothetical protein